MKSDSRPYRQKARAQAAAQTGERILDAFLSRLETGWFEEIRLDDVAHDAGVTVQTVIRRFGGKEGLLEAAAEHFGDGIMRGRALPVGDAAKAIDLIVAEYEIAGEVVIRLLAQEDRYSAIKAVTDYGRATHRRWTGEVFAPWLSRLSGEARRDAHDRLVIALDLYIWKLVRVDMKRSKAALRRTMLELCAAALGVEPGDLEGSQTPSENFDA